MAIESFYEVRTIKIRRFSDSMKKILYLPHYNVPIMYFPPLPIPFPMFHRATGPMMQCRYLKKKDL
jgi:hypothetical protein